MRAEPNIAALRYALATAQLGSFSKAARQCGVAQPTVSNAVALLEEQLGAALFVRTTRKVTLTPFGERMLPFISAATQAMSDLSDEAQRFIDPPHKLIRVGFSSLFGGARLFRLLEPFRDVHPEVELVYKECDIDDMETRLDEHRIDVIFTTVKKQRSQRRSVVVFREPLHFIPRGGSEAGAQKAAAEVSLKAVAKEMLVFTRGDCGLAPFTRELFRRRGLHPREYRGEAMTYNVLEEWAELGIGAALLPPALMLRARDRSAKVVDGHGKAVMLVHGAYWNHKVAAGQHVAALTRYLTTAVPRLVAGDSAHARP